MDLNNSKILEKAAELLSELSFNEEELHKIYSYLAKMLEKGSTLSNQTVPILYEIKGDTQSDVVFKKLIEILNDPSKNDAFQKFFSLILNNKQLLDQIQILAIEKIRDNILKSNQ